ncbi:MAG: hypothetical protein UV82_C0016G0010 [Candidatus Magasanikbacteria bacterium GW2011_GWD2_43_18]|nr:MAG: hypothetical protein UV18_C0004G0074 [Candidatus Magasanikbacteria bacterium GW2011_GWC2_42_27]KKT03756.1 MAG: hypothetical protein UV82_C0016G0010 [Candidatus Magasanikbacteria bacterium GW2011_GWD2_43_18]KKT25463.1 MAG: hypothetical protein UW10_C0007G0036 [Candidatus Magasanikbacteria bacterium GW2011_GWA2_43_9]HBB38405.1 hypothetical protein [Candidatus Magasanikbacteria bacterium]HCC14172.1 hypothetical protein [Candidatus Magasanikbacteria bacterium]
MINKTKQDLQKRLKNIQDRLGKMKELEVKKLSELGDDMFAAFDRAMQAVNTKTNIFTELKKKREQMRQWKISSLKTFFPISLPHLLSVPFIYGMIMPAIIFHICLEMYHQFSFRLYDIPRVKARDYFVYDRQRLPYLNWFEKFNCLYCSYFNNLMRYATEIAGRTERYWCPIKYATRLPHTHSQYHTFVEYLGAEDFRKKWEGLRNFSDLEEKGPEQSEHKKDPSC